MSHARGFRERTARGERERSTRHRGRERNYNKKRVLFITTRAIKGLERRCAITIHPAQSSAFVVSVSHNETDVLIDFVNYGGSVKSSEHLTLMSV